MYISSLKQLSYGMYAVFTTDESRFAGCIINSCIQVTSENPTVCLSLNKNNHTTTCLKEGKTLSLSILSENSPADIIGIMGFTSSKNTNKLEKISYKLVNGLPVLTDACGYLILKVNEIISCGTHNLIICNVIDGNNQNNEPPMTYSYYQTVIKGKSPKNAPTFVNIEENTAKTTYKCTICGYEYDKDDPSFENLPDDWVCPICGVPKKLFVKK